MPRNRKKRSHTQMFCHIYCREMSWLRRYAHFIIAAVVSPYGQDVLRSLSIHHLSVTQLLLDKITIRGYTPSVSFVPPTSTNHDPPMGVIQ